MTPITDQVDLEAFCAELAMAEFVTIDTEFMRESTYWPKLCLIQAAGPERAAAIDPLAELDLAPFFAILADPAVLKVMHAARQDIEIFHYLAGRTPSPVFDTQVAAMACGFGEQVSYETLVARLTGASIDKGSRFSDWSRRPLSDAQLSYALADVTHLRDVFVRLREDVEASGRAAWVAEEDAKLVDPETYSIDPETAWLRLKSRSENPRVLAVLQAAAAWREREAQRRDSPRNWVLRDEALLDLASQPPVEPADLGRIRGMPKGFADGRLGRQLTDAVRAALEAPPETWPRPAPRRDLPAGVGPTVDLLKVLLKAKCEKHQVAQKLVASVADLEAIAADDEAPVPCLQGWRRELFGEDALALKQGRLAIATRGAEVVLVPVEGEYARAAAAIGTRPPRRRFRGG